MSNKDMEKLQNLNNNKFRGLQLNDILKERNQNEDENFCINTDYFGFGSFENLKNAHLSNYK